MQDNSQAEAKLSILRERRSIRRFRDQPVERELILRLLDYATQAPSATNRQGWRFVVVDDPQAKQDMVRQGGSVLIGQAPCGVLVTYSRHTRNLYYQDHVQSAAACIENLLLAAQAHGLGACWLCTLPSKGFLKRRFNIPASYTPLAYVILGYPAAERPRPVPRKQAPAQIAGWNAFPGPGAGAEAGLARLYLERLLIWVYRLAPRAVKERLLNKIVDAKFTKKFDN